MAESVKFDKTQIHSCSMILTIFRLIDIINLFNILLIKVSSTDEFILVTLQLQLLASFSQFILKEFLFPLQKLTLTDWLDLEP